MAIFLFYLYINLGIPLYTMLYLKPCYNEQHHKEVYVYFESSDSKQLQHRLFLHCLIHSFNSIPYKLFVIHLSSFNSFLSVKTFCSYEFHLVNKHFGSK